MQMYSRHQATCQLLALTSSGHTARAPARGFCSKNCQGTVHTPNAVNVLAKRNNSWQFQGAPCYDHGVPTAAQVPSNLVTTIQGIKLHSVAAINL
jgi:hypothetical protein